VSELFWQIVSCCILSFGWIHAVWILCVDVSKHSVCSIFIGCVSLWRWNRQCSETSAYEFRTPGIHPKQKKLQRKIYCGFTINSLSIISCSACAQSLADSQCVSPEIRQFVNNAVNLHGHRKTFAQSSTSIEMWWSFLGWLIGKLSANGVAVVGNLLCVASCLSLLIDGCCQLGLSVRDELPK